MLAIGIRYLTGYASAADLASSAPEWPPHPGRVFLALAAAYFESNRNQAEREALEWLERLDPPDLYASEASARSYVEAYVPVNDDVGGGLQRKRQPRAFRKTRPDSDTVYLYWRDEATPEQLEALASLCGKVTRIGHSASLTQVWLCDEADGPLPPPTFVAGDSLGDKRLRVPSAGTLRQLEASYNEAGIARYVALQQELDQATKSGRAKIKKRIKEEFPMGAPEPERPQLSVWRGYQHVADGKRRERVVPGPFDPAFLVLTFHEGPAVGLESTQMLTGALRNAAMHASKPEVPPEWLSGHAEDGSPTRLNHAAFFPLPYVGAEHGDGHLLGLGIALPREVGRKEISKALGGLLFDENGKERRVGLWGRSGKWELERETRERPSWALQRKRWNGPSKRWASVTPVVLHHHPKKREGDAERIVIDAFASARYPQPKELSLLGTSLFAGAGRAVDLPSFAQGGEQSCRYQIHAVVEFEEEVEGPLLVGRGRFRGYGLFAPWEGE